MGSIIHVISLNVIERIKTVGIAETYVENIILIIISTNDDMQGRDSMNIGREHNSHIIIVLK